MGLPRVVPASRLNIFNFYANHAIHEAVFYENTILKLAKIIPLNKSEEAHHFARELSQEYTTVISPGPFLYRVWVEIRCPMDFKLSPKLAVSPSESTNKSS